MTTAKKLNAKTHSLINIQRNQRSNMLAQKKRQLLVKDTRLWTDKYIQNVGELT